MALFTDDFTGTDNDPVSGRTGWTAGTPGTNNAFINGSNSVKFTDTFNDSCVVYNEKGAADHWCECVAGANFGGPYFPLFVRNDGGRSNLYAVRLDGGLWELWNVNGGALSRAENVSGTVTAGDVIRLEAVGSSLTLKKNGTTVLTHTMLNHLTNTKVGIYPRSNVTGAAVLDNWRSGLDGEGAGGAPPAGTVTITSVTPGSTTASVVYSYSAADQDSFEYRLDGGTPAAIGASPATITGLTASTTYDIEVRAINADGNGAWSAVESFTTTTPDTTAPTVTDVGAVVKSNALAVISATTNDGTGTMRVVTTTSATPPSKAQVKAGQDHTGAAAVFAASQAIGSTGIKTFNATGHAALQTYYGYVVHTDAADTPNDSDVEATGAFVMFDDGATGQAIVDDTAAIPGVQEEGILFNDVELPADADKWFTYDVVTPVVDTASLTLFPNGSFIWTGTSADSFTYQLKVDGVDVGTPQLVTLTPSGTPDEILPELVGEITVTNLTTTSYDLSWPTGTDDTGVTGYEYSLNGGADWISNGTDTTESVTGRTPGATDQVRVRCFDAAGNRSTPALSEAVTLLTPPPDPTPSNATKRTPNGMIGFWNR